jgi:hypothetical protein
MIIVWQSLSDCNKARKNHTGVTGHTSGHTRVTSWQPAGYPGIWFNDHTVYFEFTQQIKLGVNFFGFFGNLSALSA